MQPGKEKIKKICDTLREETIEPAKQEAKEILENAHLQAKSIIDEAKKKSEDILKKNREQLEKEKQVFLSALILASKQSLAALKQMIDEKLFSETLSNVLVEKTSQKEVVEKLLEAVVEAIKKEGIEGDISAYIPKKLSSEEIAKSLMKSVLERLKDKQVCVADIAGGVKVALKDQKVTLDISDEAIKELVAKYIHRDFRQMLFQA